MDKWVITHLTHLWPNPPINFLNSLIDNAEDVKELRSKRILIDDLGSDEEVLKMF